MLGKGSEKDDDVKVSDKSVTRSIGATLGKLKSAVTNLEDVLTKLKDKNTPIDEHEVAHVQELKRTVSKRWELLNEK